MNAKFEDELMQLAFGDLSQSEAARVEKLAAADPEALKALNTYRQMFSGLREMPEVPAHQLSNDRLREAILRDGIKPKRESIWSWAWMPATAAVMVVGLFGYMNMRQGSGPGEFAKGPVDQQPIVASNWKPDASPTLTGDLFHSGGFQDAPTVEEIVAPAPVEKPVVRRSSPNRGRGYTAVTRAAEKPAMPLTASTASVGEMMGAREADDTAAQPIVALPASDSIVLIGKEKDFGTGAPIATEVEAMDVDLGG